MAEHMDLDLDSQEKPVTFIRSVFGHELNVR